MYKIQWLGAQIDMKNTTLKIKDGGSNEVSIKIGEGTLTYDETRTMEYTLDRGALDTVREGDEVPMDVSFDFIWEFLTATSTSGAVVPTIEDALKQRGEASGWVTTSADACEPYAVDIEIVYTPTCGTEEDETILLPDFRWETLAHDLSAGTVAVSGKCNAKEAIISRG
jgi:hypothetical protein